MQFLCVYIHEAHPIDGVLPERQTGTWLVGTPERALLIEDPSTLEERRALARRCQAESRFPFPVLVDGMDDAVNTTWAAWPERLYLIDVDGTVIYRGGKGPMDFRPEELAAVLEDWTASTRR